MISFIPNSLSKLLLCLTLATVITHTGLIFAQKSQGKPAIARPIGAAVKATPVSAGKATPVTPSSSKKGMVIKATPIVLDPELIDKNGKARVIEDDLNYANLLYSHKQYAIAIRQYELFLKNHPQSPNAVSAFFRLGECYLRLTQIPQAKQAYESLVKNYPTGVYAGSAAFRLATLYFNQKNYLKAIPHFEVAQAHIDNPKLELQSLYFRARSLQLTGKSQQALPLYQKVLSTQDKDQKNPFAEAARSSIASIYVKNEDHANALLSFQGIIAHSKDPARLEEAYARGGLLAAKLGKAEVSNQMLKQVLQNESSKTWKALAQIGLVFNQFAAGDYEGVIQTYNRGIYDAPADSRAQMLLLVAHSYRLTKQLKMAAKIYAIVERNYRERSEGIEAGYRHLQCLHSLKNGGLPVLVTRYVEQQKKIAPDSKYIDLALLMKAEWDFEQNHYEEAAKAYAEIRPDNIPKEHHIARLYKLGWSQIEGKQVEEGITTLSEFLKLYPDDPLASSALAKRASTYQNTKDPKRALRDYKHLAEKYPQSKELEFALQQIAIIQLSLKDTPAMIAAFLKLLDRFPETSAIAEANFWIGSGYIQQKKYSEAIPFLNRARQIDEKTYYEVATRRIILASYQLEDLKMLTAECEAFLSTTRKLSIPAPVFTYLGIKLFEDKQFQLASRYLELASTPATPEQTRPEVWNFLGQSSLLLKHYDKAIPAFDFYLKFIQRPALRSKTYVSKGKAQLGAQLYKEAKESASEALRLQKEGRINATARMLLGDIALAGDKAPEAARLYLIVSQIFVDPLITPLALHKAALAFEKSEQPEKAKQLKAKLKEKYPTFEAKES
ncbi:MAG: tetratricopeptide repeat protein [Verrucomicrobiales bacterium]|nr:tetratricopeptide repeat protein [Verrucomicrobiales bacterium]